MPLGQYYVTGYRGLGGDAAASLAIVGPGEGGWQGSTDGGRSWHVVSGHPGFAPAEGANTAAVVGPVPGGPATSVRDFGNITAVSDKMGSYTRFTSPTATTYSVDPATGAITAAEERAGLDMGGLPFPLTCGDSSKVGYYGCPLRMSGVGVVHVPSMPGRVVTSPIGYSRATANPRATLNNVSTSVFSFVSDDNGTTWRYTATIANAKTLTASEEGPNENDLVVLADGKTVMLVVRLDAGDGMLTHRYSPYYQSFSHDGGETWTAPASMGAGIGCARPRLLGFGPGRPIVMSGGRLSSTNRDVLLFVNEAGDGLAWRTYSISYQHNLLEPDTSLHFTSAVNTTASPRQSTSYTSLVRTGDRSAVLTYGLHREDGSGTYVDHAFAMPITV